jgi:hypothetical protein
MEASQNGVPEGFGPMFADSQQFDDKPDPDQDPLKVKSWIQIQIEVKS